MTVTHTELLEAEPLEFHLPPRRKLIRAGVVAAILVIVGLLGGRGAWSLGLMGVVLWLLYAGYVWFEARSFMQAKGTVLVVRNHFRTNEVNAAEVVRVKHQFNGKRPDFQLVTESGRSVWVPASKFVNGQATLFAWVTWFRPEAELDKKSTIYRDLLIENDRI